MASYEEWKKKQASSGKTSGSGYASWKATNKPDEIKAIGEQISSRVNTWLKNHSNYISNYNDRYSGRNFDYSDSYVSDSSDWLNTVTTQKSNFDKEAENILSYLDQYKAFFNEDYVKSVTEAITGARGQQGSILDSATKDNEYWSSFKTPEDYAKSVRAYGPNGYQQKYSSVGYEAIMSALEHLPEGEERDWLSYNQSTLLKNALSKNEDFEEKTKYTPTGTGEWKQNFWSGNISHDYSDIQYDYINKNEKAIEIQGTNDINSNASLYGYDKSYLQQMTADEVAIYNYLYDPNDKTASDDYLKHLLPELTRRDREESQKEWAEYSKEHPFTSSVFSTLMAPTKVLSAVGQLADYADDGAIDQNAAYNKFSYIPSTIRAQVSSDIENGAWGKVGSYGYQIGMSMGDFLVTTAATGGPMTGFAGEILNLGLMGSGAMADTVISAKDRGLSDDQALLLGGIAGGAEALFEKIGIDALFKSNMAEGAFKYIVKNMAAEGLEEGGTNIANFAADLIISKDKSEWNIAINDYIGKGLTEKEAFVEAMKDQLASVALDMIGGAISGGVLGGVGSIGNYIGNARPGIAENQNALETYAPVQNELVAEGLESAKKSDSNILAREYKKILDKGGNLSGYQIRSLVEANNAQFAVEDVDTIAGAVKERLTALGESGKLDVLSKAIAKQTAGEKLTIFEKNAIKNSKFGNRVVNELNAENIRSGQYSSDWTGNIGTTVINAEEYGRIVKAIDAEQSGKTPRISLDGEKLASSEGISLPESESVAEAQKSAPTESEEHVVDANKMVTEVAEDAPTKTEEAKSTTEAETSDAKQGETKTVTLEEASKKYGAQAQAMVHTYTEGQDVAKYDEAYKVAYDMGASGVAIDYAKKSETVSYLTERQIELAHEAGKASSDERASAIDAKNKAVANGKTGRKKGTVKGEGVTIADLKKTFNDPQGKAYKFLTDVSEVAGIDIVLYKSEANADGVFEGDQGRFEWRDDKLYIDINAGLGSIKDAKDLQKYALLRTFSHEFTHFIEKWNPVMYNEFRKVVFDTLTERGENVDNLIETKRALDNSGKMTYEKASREVVAEAMTDILPDTNFISELAEKHKTIFNKLLDRLKEFVQNLRDYFSSLGNNPSREANALKEQIGDSISYVENIVKLFDKAAMQAVENYQSTVATEEKVEKIVSTETIKAEENVKNSEDVAKNATTTDEIDSDGNPIYDTEERITEPTDFKLLKQSRKMADEKYGLSAKQSSSLEAYVKGIAYIANKRLLEGNASESDIEYIQSILEAAQKFPVYEGRTYRNLSFKNEQSYNAFLEENLRDKVVDLKTITSTSKRPNGYPLFGKYVVHMVLDGVSGRDIADTYGIPKQQEVLFLPGTRYKVNSVSVANDGHPIIFVKEIANNEVQIGEGDNERRKPEPTRDRGNDRAVPQREGDDSGRVLLRDGRGAETTGRVSQSEIRGTDSNKSAEPQRSRTNNDVTETVAESTEDFEKQYKKINRWLKKASNVYVLHHGGNTFITDGSLLIKSTQQMADKVTADFAGIADHRAMPQPIVDALDNAKTLLTNAPLEGKIGDKAVYVFNLDGKTNHVFNKALLSHLDGNRLYIGDYMGKGNIIKAVDADGNTVGLVLAHKTGGNVTDTKPAKMKSFSDKVLSGANTETVKEEMKNGENAYNTGTVSDPLSDGEGTSRLLDESQVEDVQGASSGRSTVGSSVQEESESGRDSSREHSGTGTRRSEGTGEVGDLRRDDGLTEEETTAKADELRETVTEQIEQKSTEKPKGNNFVIGDSLNLPDGEKARYRANVDAIRLIKTLEAEGRYATAAEQEILSKYVGWGGLSKAFGEMRWNKETRKSEMVALSGWEKEFSELRALIDEGIITEEEYKNASESTKNAHYTSIEVIKAMYDGLKGLGFNGGRVLEPSSGVGNFVGAMPSDMSAKVNSVTMVELDRITGQIAKYLYPNSDVRIQGFQDANIPDGYMDVAIGNVPFGKYGVVDRTYPKRITASIHNYFFAKSLDKVRTGGIVMFITSSFTMDGSETAVREYIMERADLIGAIRLPNTAFKGNAGTEVVTDIIVLKKRAPGTEYKGETFLNAPYKNIEGYRGGYVNEYFDNHPEMVLGKATIARGMYGDGTLTYAPLTDKGELGDQIRDAFKNINVQMDYDVKTSPEKANFAVARAQKKTKQGGFVVNADGSISVNEDGQLKKHDTDAKTAKRIAGMLSIRDAYRTLANHLQQGQEEKFIKKDRKALNDAYDNFVKEYGYLNTNVNKSAFAGDPDLYSVLSLENYDSKKKTATKADIFTKNTISPNKTITHVDDVASGVIASINMTGGVDTALIAKLTDKTEAQVTRELIDGRMAFKTRDGEMVSRESYLSGNVRAKLREAEALAPMDKDFTNNVEELKKVIPADIPYNEIYVSPGAAFIPNEVYADFIAEMLGGHNSPTSYRGPDVTVGRTVSGDFKIVVNNARLKVSHLNTQKWGTNRRSFLDLIEAMMGSRSVTVSDTVEDPLTGKKKSVVNKVATAAANEKVEAITKEFQDWIWRDETRRNELAKLYNETYNALVTPKYDGSSLTVNGINADYSLREHQANAVQRIIASGGNTLLAHRVGAGKTLEMASAAMKLRELGLVKKPVFVVPKSLVAQWGVEFNNYFPASRLLVADEKSFTAANRKTFANRIANGDYDAVIVSYEQFEKIPMSKEYQRQFYEEQINEIIAAIAEEKAETKGKGITVKEMEKKRAQLEKKLAELTTKEKDEDNIDFEQLGIDSLFVDEAHNFKNLQYVTRMNNVSGLGNRDGSQRAFDLYTKVRYLQQVNGGRGIVFATATPVMNSMAEMYIMQKYLQSDVLKQLGLNSFDAWAKQFGEVVNSIEIKPSGQGFRVKQTFSNFRNLNELQLLFRSFSDVLTEVPGLKIPKMKGGKVKTVECESGQFQKDFMKQLEERAENVKNVDPSVDNMLKITSDGRKISYTQRMIDPTLPYEPGCKIYKCCENVLTEYKDSKAIKGTQIVFCDMATPKGKSKSANENSDNIDDALDIESARLYDDMRDYLVKKGIPAKEIAFIHEADTDAKKKQLFEDVNEGKVRVLIGSTGKMGVGMNAQKRIVAIHHLDAPWRPGDVEQRDGRAFRQKNMNEEVSKYVYVTTGSFDARLWDILDRKQHFINQIMNGDDVGRTAEDTGEVTLSASEVKALASGNPLIMEQVQLTTEISKLEDLKKAHTSEVVRAKTKLAEDEQKIATYNTRIARAKDDIKSRVDTYSEGKFSMTVGKQTYTDKKDAGIALAAEILAKANDNFTTVGKFAGFELRVIKQGAEYFGSLYGSQGYKFNVYPNNTTYMVNHIIGVAEGLENMIKNYTQAVNDATADRDAQQNIISEPFARQAELDEKRARFEEVMAILNPKEEQLVDAADDEVQAQSRDYLDDADDDIQYQQRTNTLSDRDVLAFAADEVDIDGLTEGEQDALRIFKERIESLRTLEDERAEQGRLYREQQFGQNVDKAAAAETLNRMHVLDSKIETANADLLDVQNKTVLRSVLQKARKVVEKNQRAHDQEILDRWRDRQKNSAAIKKYRERIEKDVKDMSDWALKPNNKDIMKHIPDVLKDSVIPFITSIDFTSKQQLRGGNATKADNAFKDRLEKLTKAVKSIDPKVLYDGNYDLSPNFLPNLEALVSAVNAITKKNDGTYVINQMTSEELRALSHVVRNLKTFVKQVNRFHYNAMFQFVSDAGDSSIEAMSAMQDAKRRIEAGDKLNNWVFWQNIRPAYAFERFGEGGIAIYDGLRRGQSKLAFNTKEIVNFAETTYTAKQVQKWSEDVITIETSDGQVRMPIAMAMSFYELSKDKDGLRHILDGGVRVATFKDTDKKITTDNGHKLTQKDVFEIIDALSDEQKAVADKLQKFMAEVGGKWGNYVSVKRFGEELFGNPTYFPINSDEQHLEATVEEHPNEASLYALLNMSFTKARNEFANNRIILYNIFDVFANHMASMAQYNALALPVLDAIKWFNYQQKSEPDEFGNTELISTVREQMDRVYGVPNDRKPGSGNKGYAQQFVLGILKDFDGTGPQGTPYDSMGMKALHVYNKAQVSANLRVVIQQPLAISRAAMLIDPDAIFKGMNLAKAKENIEEMQKYSGIAAWKSLGFYDVNISRGVTHLIKHDKTWIDKVTDVGMWGAEKLDILTWAAMWAASKEQVKKKDIKPSDKDFYKEVTKLFEDVIYKTQVVDSTLTKSEYMRSKGVVARITSSFMSEPVTTASMALDAFDKIRTDMQKGMTRQQAWKRNGKVFARMAAVYAVGALLNASVQAIADAYRDDDDYQDFFEKWLEAFDGNALDELMPVNKLPIFSDFYDLAKSIASILGADTYGNPPQSVFMQWYDSLVNGFEIIYDKIMGEDTNYTWYSGIFKLLQAASGISGLPMASLTREVVTAWNNTVGAMAPSLKVKTYDAGDLSNIRFAYKDGYLTSEEAMKAILDKGLAENENDAYYIIQGWDSGDESYSKYDTIYDVIRKGESIDSAIGDLVSHGHKESGVMSTVKGEIGKWYKGGDISKQQAIDMLTKYAERFGMSSDDITKLVNEWSCKVVTGIEYNDIKSEFMEGNISASRAIEMYVRYGGKTKEKATEDVAVLQFIKENPEVEGKISSYKAVELYTTYCEDADISAETFANAYSYKGKDGVKKEEVLEYIDSLDLTRKQKNSLYYALGYAESNLWEAPW